MFADTSQLNGHACDALRARTSPNWKEQARRHRRGESFLPKDVEDEVQKASAQPLDPFDATCLRIKAILPRSRPAAKDRANAAANEDRGLSACDRAVFGEILGRLSWKSGRSLLGFSSIAKKVRFHRRSVIRTTTRLQQRGHLLIKHRPPLPGHKEHQSNLYTLPMLLVTPMSPPTDMPVTTPSDADVTQSLDQSLDPYHWISPSSDVLAADANRSSLKNTIDDRRAISQSALDEARRLAPDWDLDFLQRKFWAYVKKHKLPDNPDTAFLGWVPSFTKGGPPRWPK
jgi:hypothetical protein